VREVRKRRAKRLLNGYYSVKILRDTVVICEIANGSRQRRSIYQDKQTVL